MSGPAYQRGRVLRAAGVWSIACALLTACGATRLEEAEWKQRAAGVVQLESKHAVRETNPRLLRDPLLISTRALFVIERTTASGNIERWDLEIVGPETNLSSDRAMTSNFNARLKTGLRYKESFRANGYGGRLRAQKEGEDAEAAEALFALGFLRAGFVDACEAADEIGDVEEVTESTDIRLVRRAFRTFTTLFAMSQVANQNSVVRTLLKETVQFPSWWNLLKLSIEVSPFANVFEAERVETPFGPGWRMPFELKINGDPALYANITVVEPTGALQLCGGIVAIDGFAPNRPDQPLRIRFVGASNEWFESRGMLGTGREVILDARTRLVSEEIIPVGPETAR